eukprot:439440-Hanusia_phi.AAC.1
MGGKPQAERLRGKGGRGEGGGKKARVRKRDRQSPPLASKSVGRAAFYAFRLHRILLLAVNLCQLPLILVSDETLRRTVMRAVDLTSPHWTHFDCLADI